MSGSFKKRKILIPVTIFASIFIIALLSCAIYLNDYYKADTKAIDSFTPVNAVSKQLLDDDSIIYMPESTDTDTGFIFYPGGKVEYTAYEPLMEALASDGIMCVLLKMPFNLAVFDADAAEDIPGQYPDIKNWYIGGHSLGGSMAASYLSENTDDYKGIILLGSYSTADLSSASLKALSVYGSEDKVLNYEKYKDNLENLPDNFTEVIIDGGCHAYFGMYGSQDGDGIPAVSNVEQIEITADEIIKFMR